MSDYTLLTAVNLVFDPDGPALICKTCQYALAVPRSQVTSHLWNKHQICPGSRRDITLLIRSITIPNPTEIPLRVDQSLIHPALKVFRGYACVSCSYRTINLDMITRHVSSCCAPPCAPSKRRRNPDDLYQDVFLQTWTSGASRRYWIVRQPSTDGPLRSFSGSTHLDAIHERERAHVADSEREAMQETGLKDLELTSLWMERTQWAHVYEGARRDLLVRISQVEQRPAWSRNEDFSIGEHQGVKLVSRKADEQKITQLMAALDRAFDRCEDTMRRTGHPILCWLNSGSRNRFYQKPFGFLGRAATRQRYRRLFQRVIPFIFRAYNLTPAARKSVLGVQFTKRQLKELRRVWNDEAWDDGENRLCYDNGTVWEGEEKNGDDDGDDSDDEYEDEEDEDGEEDEKGGETKDENEIEDGSAEDDFIDQANEDGDQDGDCQDFHDSEDRYTHAPKVDKLAELIFRFGVFLATEPFTDGQPSSSLLVYYSGVLGCTEDGSTFRRSKDYTPQLSALIYIQRLLLLEFALPYKAYTYLGLGRRSRYGQLERLNEVRLESMVLGCLTPLGEFISLRSRGRKLARADPPSFLARWSVDGHTLSYDDTSISMDNFRIFGHNLIERAEALCSSLMFNWLPGVDLSQVKDDMNNTLRGYSFLQHPANGLSAAYLTLSTRACTAQGDGLLQRDRWNYKAVAEYLKRTEAFQGDLAAMMYVLCGQAPRATELLSLECCNGQSNQRGVYVYNGFMIYVIRHHKAKRSTNNEFTVVRFSPARSGKLLYYYLVYIRLFAAMLQRETSMNSTKAFSNLLFCCLSEPQRPWHSKRLTDILVKRSTEMFKKPLNIRLYRQVSICITEKHVKRLAKPFNRYDDRSADADPNVVFAWQSGHRPLQRGLTYGLNGAFPSQLQPALLNIYEWASVEWHEFLKLQSRNGTVVGEYQQLTGLIEGASATAASNGKQEPEDKLRPSHERWHSSKMRPKIAETRYTTKCKFLAPVTQKTFAVSASTEPILQAQPLSSISANFSWHPKPLLRSGQKRKHETITVDQNEGGDLRCSSELRPTTADPEPKASLFDVREPVMLAQGEEASYGFMSKRSKILAELPMPSSNTTTGKETAKQIPIWIDEGDSWRLGSKESFSPLLGRLRMDLLLTFLRRNPKSKWKSLNVGFKVVITADGPTLKLGKQVQT